LSLTVSERYLTTLDYNDHFQTIPDKENINVSRTGISYEPSHDRISYVQPYVGHE
jgi:hypothetical protein